MGDKAEKLAAAKRKFKEFQNRKLKKGSTPEPDGGRPDLLGTPSEVRNSSSPVSNSNGVDSPYAGVSAIGRLSHQGSHPSTANHSRNSSVSVTDCFEAHHIGSDATHHYNASPASYDPSVDEQRLNGTHAFQIGKPGEPRTIPSSQPAMHPATRLLRQFSQESESVASSPELHSLLRLEESRARKKNLMEFQSSKSSSAESEKTNATLSSDCFPERRRTDSVSTIYSSSDNQDRKLSYGVGDSFEHGDVLELEKRVEELAAMLNAERTRNSDTKAALSRAEMTIRELQNEIETRCSKQNEVSKGAESQLRTYAQTVEILVAEKTELERCLEAARQEVALRNSQQEELFAQAAGAARRITELESELALTRETVSALEGRGLESRLKEVEFTAEELRNELTEARARLESKSTELHRVEEKCREMESALSLATLRVQQLSNNDGAENCDNELKVLQEMNATLTTKVATLEQSLRVLELERDNAAAHYQSYVRSLNAELSSLKSSFEGLNSEKDRLVVREESLVQHVAELEKQLQMHQVKIDELKARSTVSTSTTQNDAGLKERISGLETEKEALEGKLRLLAEENDRLAAEVISLESRLERLEAEQIDMSSLQVTLESDRVAASRAIQQNNELKTRLEELQNGFIKLSNEKLELTEKLQHEQSVNKDYAEKLQLEQARNKAHAEHATPVMNNSHEKGTEGSNHAEIADEASEHPSTAKSRIDAVIQTDVEQKSLMDVEAMTKLEEKFRRKMKELADLSDEKQRLEHLVMQLQSETETIGEYVALYQTQRGALQEKAKEKDQQVVKLAQDKENLRNKLAELTELIKNLILKQKSTSPIPSNSSEPEVNGEEINAEQIMSLLSDIGTTSLSQPTTNFHPCPWCSGQLITV